MSNTARIKQHRSRAGRRVRAATEFEGVPNAAVSKKVEAVAEWLHQDIRRRGLRPGDRYLTSEEAGRLLEVSAATAHQAMRVLVERDVLSRRRKQGTYVGTAVEPPVMGVRPRVYVLSPSDASRDPTYSRLSEAFYPAISQAINGASLQLEFMPTGDGMSFVRTLAHQAEAAGDLGGFILMRSTYEVQEFFQEQRARFPAVVLGSVYPGINGLPWLDVDQRSIGRHSADYVLRAGRQHVAVLMNDHWAPGDSAFVSGIETAAKHVERLEICSLPPYEQPVSHRVRELLSGGECPIAIVAHTAFQVSVVLNVVKEKGLRIPEDVDVIMGNLGFASPLGGSIPHAVSEISIGEMGETVGRMLASLRQGQRPDPHQIVCPVRFVESSERGSR